MVLQQFTGLNMTIEQCIIFVFFLLVVWMIYKPEQQFKIRKQTIIDLKTRKELQTYGMIETTVEIYLHSFKQAFMCDFKFDVTDILDNWYSFRISDIEGKFNISKPLATQLMKDINIIINEGGIVKMDWQRIHDSQIRGNLEIVSKMI